MSRVAVALARLARLSQSSLPLPFVFIVLVVAVRQVAASEFPERECCDPIYPIPEPTSRAPSAPTPTGRSGSNIKTTVAILNCLFARQLCFEDPSCSAILEIIPRVCGPELESSTAHFRDVLDTNLLAAAITNREAVKSMRNKSGSGHIVNIISIVGLDATLTTLNMGLYTASKFGLHALTEDIRQEMTQTKTNIKVTGIYPGIVKTKLYAKGGIPEESFAGVPYLMPADIADAVVYALTRPGNIQMNQLVLEPLHANYTLFD